MTETRAKPSKRRVIPAEREIDMPPRDYQPTKAETEREIDMPGADIVTMRSAFFRRVKVKEEKPKTE